MHWSFFIQKKTRIRNGIRMTTLKTAMLQFFFMQHKKPFLAILSVAAFVDGKPGSGFAGHAPHQSER
ncbi:conserved exported hypothetical protein [Agrobacterium fabrum str. J-07]|nr:conserved exported hypothetical protein [Agrobacterium fabrum str. J-07]